MRITILAWNEKYQLRYELDRFEQVFKYDQSSYSIDEIKRQAIEMDEEVLMRFVSMRSQLSAIKNNSNE